DQSSSRFDLQQVKSTTTKINVPRPDRITQQFFSEPTKARNARATQTTTVKSLRATVIWETENPAAPNHPFFLRSSMFENSAMPSAWSSRARTFCSHASYQYLLPLLSRVHATLHARPKQATRNNSSGSGEGGDFAERLP